MTRRAGLLPAMAILVAASCAAPRAEDASARAALLAPPPVPPAPPGPEERWCRRDCCVHEGLALEKEIASRGPELEPYFLAALRHGPDAAELDRFEREARERYALWRQEISQPYVVMCVDPAVIAKARQMSLEAYVKRALGCWSVAYRSRAIAGLVIVRSRDAIPVLEGIAAEADHPLRENARSAVEKLR